MERKKALSSASGRRGAGRGPDKIFAAGAVCVVVIVAVIVGVIFSRAVSGRRISQNDTKEGVAYIQSQEQTEVALIENKIKEVERAERKTALSEGNVDVWRMLDDTVIMGDSRAVGFSYHEFVDGQRVLAEGGATIRNIPDQIETLKLLNPSGIFLCYGLNDISIGNWDTVEEYMAELDTVVELIRSNVEGAVVYVNSIIPLAGEEYAQAVQWLDIPDWNVQIKQHCEEKGIAYLDLNGTVEEHKDLYDPDGIHLQKEFYPYWGIEMVMEESENE
ncbi:MAG: GDSL-type esterase/lipase family protein [Eubacteriales bacterium]|nr:GDSL-type esterase/lipase family protein [Eubacteriales bacterium]